RGWTISFADTGSHSMSGQRLLAERQYLGNDEVFPASYAGGLSNLNLDHQLEDFNNSDAIGSFLCVKPNLSYHFISVGQDRKVTGIDAIRTTNVLVNGGFFIFHKEIFNYIRDGEELVEEPFGRLIGDRKLIGHRDASVWYCMDTFKDRQVMVDLADAGGA